MRIHVRASMSFMPLSSLTEVRFFSHHYLPLKISSILSLSTIFPALMQHAHTHILLFSQINFMLNQSSHIFIYVFHFKKKLKPNANYAIPFDASISLVHKPGAYKLRHQASKKYFIRPSVSWPREL